MFPYSGCFLGGFLFDYLNGHLLLGVALALSAILEMVVPLCKPFTAMAIVLGVARLFAGAIMAGKKTHVSLLSENFEEHPQAHKRMQIV